MKRREFLQWMGAASALSVLPGVAWGAGRAKEGRSLVLVKFAGGNDGLNTVIPYSHELYYALRPSLAVSRGEVLKLDGTRGLHPALRALMKAWEGGDMAVVEGLGYPEPNRSHFRSIDIWEMASGSDAFLSEGWLSRGLLASDRGEGIGGVILGGEDVGPLRGGVDSLVMEDPRRFIREAKRIQASSVRRKNAALNHVLDVQKSLRDGASVLEERLGRVPSFSVRFPGSSLGRQMEVVARMVAASVPVPVFTVTLKGFDTHANQAGPHGRLLREFAEAMAAFRDALREQGAWDRVMVMTYSEFGRRARENGSGGTDHGTAAPHFVLGGALRGGFFGEPPSLSSLRKGDLRYTTDFRRLYATVLGPWLSISSVLPGGSFRPLSLVS